MDHDVVVRQKMTERYLLDELDPAVRDEFEEHYFGCPECAVDVRAGALFVEQSKVVLAETELLPAVKHVPPKPDPWWHRLLRPAFAVPGMASLLLVVGYQNWELRQAARPQVLPLAMLNLGTYGSESSVISARAGEGFLLLVRITPDNSGNVYTHYIATLYNPAGKLDVSLTISAASVQEQVPVYVPGASRVAGKYVLKVQGVTESEKTAEIASKPFELQIQN